MHLIIILSYQGSLLAFYTGLSIHDIGFIKVAGGIIILVSTIRLLLELLWLIRQVHLYFADFGICTLVEVPLFVSSIIFAVVFDRECLCPRDWQWQVGIVAVFLVWIDLLLYMRRMRILGSIILYCRNCQFHVFHTSGKREPVHEH